MQRLVRFGYVIISTVCKSFVCRLLPLLPDIHSYSSAQPLVPDSMSKRIYIKSTYKRKSSSDQVLNMESVDSPQRTPKASHGNTASDNSISRSGGNVNRSFPGISGAKTMVYGTVLRGAVSDRLDLSEDQRKKISVANDGDIYSVKEIHSVFVDNLKKMGYNEKQIDSIIKGEISYDNKSEDAQESLGQVGERRGNLRRTADGLLPQNVQRGTQREVHRTGEVQEANSTQKAVQDARKVLRNSTGLNKI